MGQGKWRVESARARETKAQGEARPPPVRLDKGLLRESKAQRGRPPAEVGETARPRTVPLKRRPRRLQKVFERRTREPRRPRNAHVLSDGHRQRARIPRMPPQPADAEGGAHLRATSQSGLPTRRLPRTPAPTKHRRPLLARRSAVARLWRKCPSPKRRTRLQPPSQRSKQRRGDAAVRRSLPKRPSAPNKTQRHRHLPPRHHHHPAKPSRNSNSNSNSNSNNRPKTNPNTAAAAPPPKPSRKRQEAGHGPPLNLTR